MRNTILSLLDENRRLAEALTESAPQLEACARLVIGTLRDGCKVLICGNGGSAADAQHIAAELAGRYRRDRPALAGLALSTDTSVLTAVGNDYGYERVFSRQVEALGQRGDLLWAISTSGNSPNVLWAIESARQKGLRVLGFTGLSGGKMAETCDLCFKAPTENTPFIQQTHQIAYHIICELVESALFPKDQG